MYPKDPVCNRLLSVSFVLLIHIQVFSSDKAGDLDLTFGNSGLVTTDFSGPDNDWGEAVTIQEALGSASNALSTRLSAKIRLYAQYL